jgi:nitrogenase-associated protein
MADILFYTKPGCATSAKQVELLEQSGHSVEVRDLLAHPWSQEELASYFGELPVSGWFNEKSPRVKSGEIDPAVYDSCRAYELLLSDHLLIRRPLLESAGRRMCGFDPVVMHAWVGLGEALYERSRREDYSSCSQPSVPAQKCP